MREKDKDVMKAIGWALREIIKQSLISCKDCLNLRIKTQSGLLEKIWWKDE